MIQNFICEDCKHYMVCDKMKHLLKFDDSAKKSLMIDITMDGCINFESDGEPKNSEN